MEYLKKWVLDPLVLFPLVFHIQDQREIEAPFSSVFLAVHPFLVLCNESPLSLWFPSLHLTDWLMHLDLMNLVRALSSHKCLRLLSLKDVTFSMTDERTN